MNKIKAFIYGMLEFRSDLTIHYEDLALAEMYDKGRDFAHCLIFRMWD